MRHFVELEPDGTVKAEVYSDHVPGAGPDIPANIVEVTSEPGHETTQYAGRKKRAGGVWVDLPVPAGGPTVDERLTAIEGRLAAIAAKVGA